ncbi:MAG TPA: fibronectin type III domain-containing protein [Terriglobia bacterium]|nr:fibronectin type III domain-containing protein [Terriglobia bacterium]
MTTQVPDSTTQVAPVSTSTVPAATTNKKPASLKAVTGFGKLDPNALANTAHHIAKGVGGYPQYFGNPPVDPAALDASANTLSEAVLAAMDGGKTAKAVVKKQRKLIVQDLNLLAVFVQNVSGDDPVIFAASGFTAKQTGKSAPQPVAVPSFRYLDFGMNSGQIRVAVKRVAGARSYFIRYAVMNGTTPGPWTTVPAASIQKPITISGLTPITMYGFQVQALGLLGYSDWSTTETIVVN